MHHHDEDDKDANLESNVKRIQMFIRIRSSDIALQYRSRQIARPQKTKIREKYVERVYRNDEKGDVPSKRECEWRELESFTRAPQRVLMRPSPIKWEASVRGLGW